ncbi:hypothetical protein EON63_09280 [archaeon]|nr:MAG: hypothetical protein EON63_09280 [archaeon]
MAGASFVGVPFRHAIIQKTMFASLHSIANQTKKMLKEVSGSRVQEALVTFVRFMVVLLTTSIMFPTMVAYAFIPMDTSLPQFLDAVLISYEFFGNLALKTLLCMGEC